jgi:predicted adenine nucleotide alpha hydrolase (AANH) superfamily ATPase
VYPVERLRGLGYEVRGLFWNPNIQPYQEYLRRRGAVEVLAKAMDLPVIFMDDYPLEEFFRRAAFREGQRCRLCYQWRLERAARVARRGRCDAFTTTLLFSKRQRHPWVREAAEAEAASRGVPFLYEDFRMGWDRGSRRARELGLYRQAYCGCVYSERDRFRPRGGDPVEPGHGTEGESDAGPGHAGIV